ncbi:MAG: class I tRNA ligase family protein [Candidatus Limnocylindrales bacterium]
MLRYGADAVRLFLMFMGPWDQGGPWSPTGIGGVFRFLNRVWTLALDPSGREPGDPEAGHLPAGETEAAAEAAIRGAAHRTLRDVTEDYEGFRFNTMVAKLMELSNTLFRYRGTPVADGPAWDEAIRLLLLMLAPAAPHISEELWSRRLVAAGEPWASIHTGVVAGGRRGRHGRLRARDPGPGQRQAARQGDRARRRDRRRHRSDRPRESEDRIVPGRPGTGSSHPGRRRRAAREPGRPVTRASRGPGGAYAITPAQGPRQPPARRRGRTYRTLTAGSEGTGKRIRHVKVRSVEDAGTSWVRTVIEAQLAHRTE